MPCLQNVFSRRYIINGETLAGQAVSEVSGWNHEDARVHLAMDGAENVHYTYLIQLHGAEFSLGINAKIELAHAGKGEDVVSNVIIVRHVNSLAFHRYQEIR